MAHGDAVGNGDQEPQPGAAVARRSVVARLGRLRGARMLRACDAPCARRDSRARGTLRHITRCVHAPRARAAPMRHPSAALCCGKAPPSHRVRCSCVVRRTARLARAPPPMRQLRASRARAPSTHRSCAAQVALESRQPAVRHGGVMRARCAPFPDGAELFRIMSLGLSSRSGRGYAHLHDATVAQRDVGSVRARACARMRALAHRPRERRFGAWSPQLSPFQNRGCRVRCCAFRSTLGPPSWAVHIGGRSGLAIEYGARAARTFLPSLAMEARIWMRVGSLFTGLPPWVVE